ncbi:Cob-chelat-sub: cobaltochelatase subunit [Actinomadura rubteroloni]|uniref:Cob-chelat-sub: cobaltochelatase subunit n=1 Tax=Actinomadura rubteroloni TaxID=1926885 RepID=A0A2P4UN36_9ACTN|nr:VWA domain-containing protein [Actinomadura rubteroloni]POM26460.1 Cob-chelat-sub: cobaltochelatase subunit [Actinomadura rubteroloni]
MAGNEPDSPFAAVRRPRPLPVLVLADVSGSMAQDGKIESLNSAMAEMVRSFAAERSVHGEIMVGVIAFGGTGVALHHPPTPAADFRWADMSAVGGPHGTPMGDAFELARSVLHDEDVVPSRAYAPTLVLVSDGAPTSEWEQHLDRFLSSPRGARSLRLAVAIGSETGTRAYRVLESFVRDPRYPVVRADEAPRIAEIFRSITRSVSVRARSTRPDDASMFDLDDLFDLSD